MERYRGRIKGLNKCRRSGQLDGVFTLIVPRSMLQFNLMGRSAIEGVIWDGFEPTEKEQEVVSARLR